MVGKIYDYVKQYNMLEGCNHIVVGLSGGADSVCLLLVLHSIIKQECPDVRLTAVHINHGIRGDEAERDEAFARCMCERLGVGFVCKSFDIPAIAVKEGVTIEEAGRKVRYAVFAECAGDSGRIAVAHHMDDQAETMLMNLFRGSGLKGASGMSPVRDNIIRPLLCVTRQEIEKYLEGLGQDYVTDSTNSDNVYTRNRLRNELLPYIREHFNGEVVRHLSDMSKEFRECEEYLNGSVQRFIDEYVTELVSGEDEGCNGYSKGLSVELVAFEKEPRIIRSRVVLSLMKMLSKKHKDIYRAHVESVIGLVSMLVGKRVSLPYNMVAVRTYDSIEFRVDDMPCEGFTNDFSVQVDIEDMVRAGGVCEVPVGMKVFDGERLSVLNTVILQVCDNIFLSSESENVKNNYTKFFNCDKIKGTLCLRFRREGDIITISSDGSKKKLKKELIDKKVPSEVRDKVMLLAEDDNILWAAGVRRCEDYLVECDTSKVLKVSLVF